MTMRTEITTLTEFLLARIAEDEAAVDVGGTFGPPRPDGAVLQRWDYDEMLIGPARVLAECEAKRRIVAWAETSSGEFHWGSVLAPLAAVYADHPDYRDDWRP